MSFEQQAWPRRWTVADVPDGLTFSDLVEGDTLIFEGNGSASGTGSLTRVPPRGTPSRDWATDCGDHTHGADRVHLTHTRSGRGFTVIRKAFPRARTVLECWPTHLLDASRTALPPTDPSWTAIPQA